MKVILRTDVAKLGHKGDVLEVSAGYARNYLVPQGLALNATAGAVRQAGDMQRARQQRDERERDAILAKLPKNVKPEIMRFKGLGEMMPEQLKATTLEAKVIAFEKAFLRAGVKHYPSRQQWAKVALDAGYELADQMAMKHRGLRIRNRTIDVVPHRILRCAFIVRRGVLTLVPIALVLVTVGSALGRNSCLLKASDQGVAHRVGILPGNDLDSRRILDAGSASRFGEVLLPLRGPRWRARRTRSWEAWRAIGRAGRPTMRLRRGDLRIRTCRFRAMALNPQV